jgi:PAS domain S-box-containing protein
LNDEEQGRPVAAPTKTGPGGNRGVTILALWVPLIFTLAVVYLAFEGQHTRDLDARWVLHTVEVKDQVEHLNSLVRDIGAGERGYLLTGDASFLPLYENALKEIPTQSDQLAHLVEDNPTQVATAAQLQVLIAEKLSMAAQALSLVQQEKIPETLEVYRDTQGKLLNDKIRAQVETMTAEEDRLLAARENIFASQVKSERNEMAGLVVVEIVLIGSLTLFLRRSRNRELTADERIEEANVMTDEAQASTFKAIVRTDQAEARAGEAATRTEAAEATTALLYTCVSHLNDIVLITEAGTTDEPGPRIVFVNEAFERMTGYASAEALGKSPRFLQGAKTDRRILDEIHQAVAQQKPIRRQIINYHKDGSEFWLDIDIAPIFDAAGKCTHFAGIERDITDEKNREESLNLFRALIEKSPDAIEVIDPDTGRFLDVNTTGCARLGYSREEMLSLHVADIDVERDYLSLWPVLVEKIKETGFATILGRHRRKDGSTFPVEINSRYIDLNRGYMVAVVRDITERRKAEEIRKITEGRYRALFDYAPDGILIVNPENIYIAANPSIYHLLGYSGAELIGLRIPDIVAETDIPRVAETLSVIRGNTSHHREWKFRRKDGSIVEVDAFSTLMPDGNILAMIRDVTKRNEAELALKTSESRYSTLFRNMLGGYAYCRVLFDLGLPVDMVYLDVNDALENLTGLKDVVGKKISEVIPGIWETNPELLLIYGRVALTGKSESFETYLKPLGIWLSIAVYSDKAEHISAVFENISERKRNEGRFRRLVDSNAQSIMFWNTKGEITGANDAFLHLIRYTREDLEAGLLVWTEITAPEYADLDRRAMGQIAARGACAPYRKEFIRKDGVRVSVMIGGANFEDNPEEGVAFALDLTERECAAEQIAEQAALLDEAQDAIIVRDLEGKAIFWNKGAERMYGWTRQEILGLNISEILFVHPIRFAEVNALTISEGKWSGELQHLTKDKRAITIEARWTLIQDKEGQPKSVLAINTDITERKKIEAQFMRAQRMESIGTLAGGIAHDLNNILAPIMMSIDILKSTPDGPQKMQLLETIEVSSQRGADIVRQVLSFARGLEGQRIEIQPAHLLKDLKSIIKDTFPKNIRLQFTIPNDKWAILGDPTQVHQILLNLCVNARDAMPNGGNLTVSVANCVLDEHYAAMHIEAKAGRYVRIDVTDSGTGIPQDILDKIFEPFFTTKEVNEGTGLGLSTVMAIVKSHEGIIDVYSELGKGTTFKVYLPAMELSVEAQKLVTQQISVPRGKGETILVVDDEPSILIITSQTLQAFGYRVLTAADGAEAVAAYVEHRKDIAVVLTDMSMPVMDGAAVIRALTKINPEIRIIAASGLNANGEAAKVSGVSAQHFLTKPYTAGTLLKTLRAILEES